MEGEDARALNAAGAVPAYKCQSRTPAPDSEQSNEHSSLTDSVRNVKFEDVISIATADLPPLLIAPLPQSSPRIVLRSRHSLLPPYTSLQMLGMRDYDTRKKGKTGIVVGKWRA